MPRFKDFEAYITDENWNPLEEFLIEEFEDEKLVTCYVPSVSNQVHSFRSRCHTRLEGSLNWTSVIHVDGTKVASKNCGPYDIAKLSTVVASENLGRYLTFADLKLTGASVPRQRKESLSSDIEKYEDNDEEARGTANDLESLGTITVSFVRFRASGKLGPNIHVEAKDQVLHERNKKAGCHRVSFGDPFPHFEKAARIGDFLDKVASPQLKIVFRYRSIDILQAQEIAPRPEPIPEEDANPADPSDREEGSSGGKRNADGDPSHSKPRSKKKRRVKLEDEEVANMRVRDFRRAITSGPSDVTTFRETFTSRSLGDPISKVAKPVVMGTYLDLYSRPQFTFLFHYRSVDVLQAKEIAPRPKVVPPRKKSKPDDQSTPAEGSSQGKRPADEVTKPARKKQCVKKEDTDMLSQREEVAIMRVPSPLPDVMSDLSDTSKP
ncbi:hypothetical protein NLI96_g1759 [Meripilus lineatus]|uniref:DUF7918 domain-containing protein n=1 Tax=Meripilus lineatus TaxID=2056292 RepID=A0AAD5YMJ4_9APHY|nr:hypothetical protein NLI96_g1759 [Physisporinus lineatus]